MRNKIGGQFLLDISMIALLFNATEYSISNVEILKQLNEFSTFIDPSRVYTKQSPQNVKPVTIRYRSSADELDGVMYGQACFYDDALKVVISGSAVDSTGTPRTIIINVTYEFVEYVGYQVKTAKITATDKVTGEINISNIIDDQGNKRFVEGDIEIEDITGVTQTYGKWSLSGTHLMIVICFDIANNTTISANDLLASFELPEWIFDKIVPISGKIVSYNANNAWDSSYNSQAFNAFMKKETSGIQIVKTGNTTLTSDKSVRLVFDLLIDTEAPVESDAD